MKEIMPRYMRAFRCIAGACRHSCCIGWEIDIDTETLEAYRQVKGDFGKRLSENIADDGENACFRLGADERCPFLNGEGLCDIYTELGQDALCQICTDHPRFRNYFSNRTEIGVGLCCEAASDLVLSQRDRWEFDILFDDGEDEMCDHFEDTVLVLRERLFSLIQSGAPVSESCEKMLSSLSYQLPNRDWVADLRALEQLDPNWGVLLTSLSVADASVWEDTMDQFDGAFRNLVLYFLYRHLPNAVDHADLTARVGFAYLSYRVIRALCAGCKDCTMEELVEFARMYSSEIEYSEENTEMLLNLLGERA